MAKVTKPNEGGGGSGGSTEDQIRDKIDRLLFGGTRFQKNTTTKEDEEEPEFFRENCRTMQLRPGVQILEYDFGPSLAEDFDTGIHPEMVTLHDNMNSK